MALLVHLAHHSPTFSPSNTPHTPTPASSPLRTTLPLFRPSFPTCIGLRICLPASKTAPVAPPRISRGIVCEQQQETITGALIVEAGAVTDQTWRKLVLESEIPVLVDFWAPWCGPCRMIAPLVDELAKQYAGKLRCLKLNTDESPNTATEYGIRSIPTVMIFKRGEKRDTIIGAVPKDSLMATVEKYLIS